MRLLAVDLGLRTGLARIGRGGRVEAYRSTTFPDRARLKRGAGGVWRSMGLGVELVVCEGDPRLARVWAREAARDGVGVEVIAAGDWRPDLLWPRDRRSGRRAKAAAETLARHLISWSEIPGPTSMTDDVAEAICVGFHAAWVRGHVDPDTLPPELLARLAGVPPAGRASP